MFIPLQDSFVQHRVDSCFRATYGSLQSFIGSAGRAVSPLLVWMLIQGQLNSTETISMVWLVAGFVLVGGAVLLWLIRPRNES